MNMSTSPINAPVRIKSVKKGICRCIEYKHEIKELKDIIKDVRKREAAMNELDITKLSEENAELKDTIETLLEEDKKNKCAFDIAIKKNDELLLIIENKNLEKQLDNEFDEGDYFKKCNSVLDSLFSNEKEFVNKAREYLSRPDPESGSNSNSNSNSSCDEPELSSDTNSDTNSDDSSGSDIKPVVFDKNDAKNFNAMFEKMNPRAESVKNAKPKEPAYYDHRQNYNPNEFVHKKPVGFKKFDNDAFNKEFEKATATGNNKPSDGWSNFGGGSGDLFGGNNFGSDLGRPSINTENTENTEKTEKIGRHEKTEKLDPTDTTEQRKSKKSALRKSRGLRPKGI